jgi:uncharacterized protein (DUF169 family)
MEKAWQNQLDGLAQALDFRNLPVAITFTNDEMEAREAEPVWLCAALKRAAAGETIVVDKEHSGCPGGSWHCGFTPPHSGPGYRILQKFLTRGEKLTHSIMSFYRMEALGSPPPTGVADFLVLGPVKDSPLMPDVVLFLANGAQACRLIALDTFWDGIPPRIELTGSLCHAAIAYPAVTGNTNVTFGDWTARRQQGYGDEVVFVSIPYERVHNLVAAVPECSAGTAPLEVPPEMQHFMD